jgi:hypothetical protein
MDSARERFRRDGRRQLREVPDTVGHQSPYLKGAVARRELDETSAFDAPCASQLRRDLDEYMGIQSPLGVALVALSLLSYFGHPFDQARNIPRSSCLENTFRTPGESRTGCPRKRHVRRGVE